MHFGQIGLPQTRQVSTAGSVLCFGQRPPSSGAFAPGDGTGAAAGAACALPPEMRNELCCGGLGALGTRTGAGAGLTETVAIATGAGVAGGGGAGATGAGVAGAGLEGIAIRTAPEELESAGAGAGTGVGVGAGRATATAAEDANCRWISALANSRALLLQPGQFTFTGIRPFTGSTSKANLVPQPHWIFTFMFRVWGSTEPPSEY